MKKYINPLKLGLLIAVLANTCPVYADITADINKAKASSTDPAKQANAVALAVANAIAKSPKNAVAITSAAVKDAAPGLFNEIVKSAAEAVKLNLTKTTTLTGAALETQVANFLKAFVNVAIKADPSNAPAIVTAAIKALPQKAEEISKAAFVSFKESTGDPRNIVAITAAAVKASPADSTSNITADAIRTAPASLDNDIVIAAVTTQNSENTVSSTVQVAYIIVKAAEAIATAECKGNETCYKQKYEEAKNVLENKTSDPADIKKTVVVIEKPVSQN